jgi:hypothetical protein
VTRDNGLADPGALAWPPRNPDLLVVLHRLICSRMTLLLGRSGVLEPGMTSGDHPGLSTALLVFGGAGVLLFPLASGLGIGDPTYFVIAVPAVLVPLLQRLRGQGIRLPDALLLGFLITQLIGGVIQAFTDGSGDFARPSRPLISPLCSAICWPSSGSACGSPRSQAGRA